MSLSLTYLIVVPDVPDSGVIFIVGIMCLYIVCLIKYRDVWLSRSTANLRVGCYLHYTD